MLDTYNKTAVEAIEAAIKIKSHKRVIGPAIEDVLKVGKLMSDRAKETPSTKVLGLMLKEKYPEIASLQPCYRSDCRWLYEALLGERDADILDVLDVSRIEDFKSQNPTVIRREYRGRCQEH